MKKIICLIIFIIILSACSYSIIGKIEGSNKLEVTENKKNNAEHKSSKSIYENIIQISINESLIMNNLKKICLHPRKFGTEGENTTLNYLKGKLEEYGYTTYIQDFSVYKQDFRSSYVKYNNDYFKENPYNSDNLGTAKNIIAKRDNHSYTKKTIYLTAHYDTTPDTTGVIDNGTGVCVILGVANQLKNYNTSFNIEIVLFSGEEYFKSGSRAFVSNLSIKEKKNAIACINVDMVGEKGAGDLIMRANTGEHNILTLMINHQLKKQLQLLEGGYSDDLSFYLGKIPVITLTNKNSNPSKSKEKNQYQYIDLKGLKNTVNLITNFLINFNSNVYNKILNDKNITSNKTTDNSNITDKFITRKAKVINGFRIRKINANLLGNGYDSETEYIYENGNGKKYIIAEQFNAFINPTVYNNYKTLLSSYKDSTNYKCIYLVNEDSKSDTKVFYSIGSYYGKIKGDMSTNEALNILRAYYKEEYKKIFGNDIGSKSEKPSSSIYVMNRN